MKGKVQIILNQDENNWQVTSENPRLIHKEVLEEVEASIEKYENLSLHLKPYINAKDIKETNSSSKNWPSSHKY